MVVNRLHSKLFEAAALDLDRRTRFHFVGQNVRPDYLTEIERDLQDVMKPDMEGELQFMIHVVESGPYLAGRFLGLKNLVKRVLHPFSAYYGYMHRMLIQRLIEQNETVQTLTKAVKEENTRLRQDFAALAETVRSISSNGSGAETGGSEDSVETTGSAIVPAGSRLILGPVAVKPRGYLHFDSPTMDRLPVAPGSVVEVVVANILESYPVGEVRDALLPYWASLLQPGGKLSLIADDLGAAGDRFRDGQIEFDELASVLFGEGRRPRRSAYTPEMLWRYVEEAGLTDLSVTSRKHRPELGAYGFELTAFRDAD